MQSIFNAANQELAAVGYLYMSRKLVGKIASVSLAIFGLTFGSLFSLWAYYHEKTPSLAVQVVGVRPVTQEDTGLTANEWQEVQKYLGENQKALSLYTLRIINNGQTDLRQSDFEPNANLTIAFQNVDGIFHRPFVPDPPDQRFNSDLIIGTLLFTPPYRDREGLTILEQGTNDPWNLSGVENREKETGVVLKPFTIDRNESFEIKMMVRHPVESTPKLTVHGKISGIKSIEVLTGANTMNTNSLVFTGLFGLITLALGICLGGLLGWAVAIRRGKRATAKNSEGN